MSYFKYYIYLTVFIVFISIAQTELDISNTRSFRTVFSNLKAPEQAIVGEVISFTPKDSTILFRTRDPYDPFVLGVVTTDSAGELRVAVAGEVDVFIDKTVKQISAGEWIVTSGSSGRAMPLDDDFPFRAVVLGIALEDWALADSLPQLRIMLTPGEKITPKRRLSAPQ